MSAVKARQFLGPIVLLLAVLAGCATQPHAGRIVEVASGRTLSRAELAEALRRADFVLLGEQHDNPLHHRLRGELVADLGPGAAVVAEQLTRGRRVDARGELLPALNAAGFDAQGWDWPLHAPLFGAVVRAGLPLSGGNLPRDTARRIAREGDAALEPALAALLQSAPLNATAQAALDADLVAGHCGQLRDDMTLRLRRAQRARDASLAAALVESAGRPAVLVAGNGHVRRDYGVPQLLAALRPGAVVASVGFLDGGEPLPGAPYTHVWTTTAPRREDPCAALQMPR
jgi:uncharacterized iron-regulated protein